MSSEHVNRYAEAPKLRVLVVEDDEIFRQDHALNLSDWGYEVFLAEGEGHDLLADAQQKTMEKGCNIALVDMSLLSDDGSDKSGLTLLPKLLPTVSIIVTGYTSTETAVAALKDKKAVDFVGKAEGPDRLHRAIEKAADDWWAVKKRADIRWPETITEATIIERFGNQQVAHPIDEMKDALARLFPDAKVLRLETIKGADHASLAPRWRAIVLKAWADNLEPVIVKVARSKRMQREVQSYNDFISGWLVDRYYARLHNDAILWNLGAATYEFMGTSLDTMQTFSQYYRHASPTQLRRTLRRLFSMTWSRHYQGKMSKPLTSVFELYSAVWGTEWLERLIVHRELATILPQLLDGTDIPNAIGWVLNHYNSEAKIEETGYFDEMHVAITHGDLQGDNVLVDGEGNAWVIDYERTGLGPVLQDFVQLEIDILTRLVDVNVDRSGLFQKLAKAIVSPTQIGNSIRGTMVDGEEAKKAIRVVNMLRRLAKQQTKVTDIRQYLWGLLLNAVFRATLLNQHRRYGAVQGKRNQEVQRALLLAGYLCQRLDALARKN